MKNPFLVLYFPEMHKQAAGSRTIPGLNFLDPGLEKEMDLDAYFRPAGLPLDPGSAEKWLKQALNFAGQFNPKELAFFNAGKMEDFYSNTSMAIRSELMGLEKGALSDQDESMHRLKAQMTLLLAWAMERDRLEIAGIDQGLSETWEKFEHNLGLEPGDRAQVGHSPDIKIGNAFAPTQDEFSWKPVLEAFLCLMPEDAVLFVEEPMIYETWLDQGLNFSSLSRKEWKRFHPEWGEALSGALHLGVHQGFAFIHGKPRPDGEKGLLPWLALPRTVLYLERDGGEAGD
ncbi:MAG: hypothetical protein SVS15_08090 [Thermodesulfobacteriota bacterium]|nr:hypothetical protein [Thermodesulfobacteriota bacterium]